MTKLLAAILGVAVFIAPASAQKKTKAKPVPQVDVSGSLTPGPPQPLNMPFPKELLDNYKDLMLKDQELDLENLRMQVQIEKNNAVRQNILDQKKSLGYSWMIRLHLDPAIYEIDEPTKTFHRKAAK